MNYVIIGNSAAAIGTVEGIRQLDKEGKITIISDEVYHTYSRPLISYLLLGKSTLESMKYRKNDFYQAMGVQFLAGKKVVSIDNKNKAVKLESGESVPYDKLMVATGSCPFVPPVKGLETVNKYYTFGSLDDAKALQEVVKTGSKVLILGAGLIGLKCAEGISKLADITLVDMAERPLSSILDEESGELIKNHLIEKGLNLQLGDSIAELKGNRALLNSGTEIDFDVLVIAVGVRPNVSLVKEIGGAVGRGITVDSKSKTSIEDIYSAGDCTESFDISSDETKIMALLPNAYMQGEVAGIDMAGGEADFTDAIPMNAIGFFGLHMVTAGSYKGDVFQEKGEKSIKKLYYSDNKLNGFIIIGDVSKSGIYTSLIREKTPLDSIDFDLICENPGLIAFSKEKRDSVLGGKA